MRLSEGQTLEFASWGKLPHDGQQGFGFRIVSAFDSAMSVNTTRQVISLV